MYPPQPQPYQGYQPQQPVQPPVQQYQYPQQVYQPQPPYPPYQGTYTAQAPAKRRMSTGAKVFLIIAGIFALAGISAAVMYFALAVGNSSVAPEREPFFGYEVPDDDDGSEPWEDEDPDFGVAPPEEEESHPEVDVTPNTDGIAISPRPSGSTMDAEGVYNRVVTSTVTVSAKLTQEGASTGESTGTGIIATSDGYIITNSHVVLNSRSAKVTVTTFDGLEYEAVVVGVDRTTDLAVLKTNDHNFVPAEFGDAEELSVGEWVLAIGNPGGARFSSSLTRGIISGLDREVGKYSEEGMTYIQTDAAINPGNSGGALVDLNGLVVGINSSKIAATEYEGMGFAIPSTVVQPIVSDLIEYGYVRDRAMLGITGAFVNRSMSSFYGLPQGYCVGETVTENAKASGLKTNDIITAIDDTQVVAENTVSSYLATKKPGDKVTLTVDRPLTGESGLKIELTLSANTGSNN